MMHYNTKLLKADSVADFLSITEYDAVTASRWYAIGVYAADGYNGGNGLSLEVQASDEAWVRGIDEIIMEWFGVAGSWNYKTLNGRVYVRVRHHSVLLSQYFTDLYVPKAKTLGLELNPFLPTAYTPAFLLGYSDGNGWISHRHRSKTAQTLEYGIAAGSLSFLNGVQQTLSHIAMGHIREGKGHSASIEWHSSASAEAVLDYLYTNTPQYRLQRKFDKYMGWKNRTLYTPATKTWTDAEKQFVAEHMDSMLQKDMAHALNKGVSSVGAMVWRIRNHAVRL